ncbi:MAG TPA: hypothetical protein PL124_12595, partial [Candidatus Cloacimonadota bacterium]|nr:hypothetical protein [Candidatus Cloacimonadota bacterium]
MIYRIRIMRLENGVLVFDRYATEMNLLDLRVSTDGKVEKLVRCKWLESEAERHELLQKPTTVVLGYHNNACHNLIYAEWIDVSATHFVEWGEDVDALRSRIAELEAENKYLGNMPVNTVKAPDAIIYDNALDANRELRITVKRQQEQIAELEKLTIVWHKYPDEKPDPSHEYEVNIPVMIYSMNGCTYFADYNIDSG